MALWRAQHPRPEPQPPFPRALPRPYQVGGILRIAHCGGLHVPQLNKIVDALNFIAKLLHRRIRWDTETLGCVPSLSSSPSMEQRLLTDTFPVGGGRAGCVGGGGMWLQT